MLKAAFVAAAALPTFGKTLRGDVSYYSLESGWPSGIAGLNVTEVTAVAVGNNTDGFEVHVAQRGAAVPYILVFDPTTGNLKRTWGAGGVITSPHGISTQINANATSVMWIADIAGPTLHAFTIDGTLLHTVGTPGKGGNGVAPPQFSAPADIARTGNDGTDGFILVSDGDGGSNNRVLNLVYGSNQTWDVVYGVGGLGTGPGQFNSPHSIAYQASMKRFWVADRGNTRLQIFDSTNGEYLGEWGSDCFNGGTPWGVRVDDARNRVVVADGTTGQLYILDATKANTKPFPSACDPASTVLQSFTIGVAEKPHLVEVDYWTGDVYLASVGTPTLIQKYTRTG